jgi:hypothetical protein
MDTHINSPEISPRAGELGDPMQRKAGYQAQSAAMLTAMQASTVSARALAVHEAFASAQ